MFIDPNEVEQSSLMAHNYLRGFHLSPTLLLSVELSKQAQLYADEIVNKHKGILVDSALESRPDQGENLAIHCDPHDAEMTERRSNI